MARQKIDPEIMKFITGSVTPDYFAPASEPTPWTDSSALAVDFEKAKQNQGIPELEPMAELPMPDGEQARQARRRSLLKQKRRRGRESTILSSPVSLLSEEIGV